MVANIDLSKVTAAGAIELRTLTRPLAEVTDAWTTAEPSGTRVVLNANGTEIAAMVPAGQPVPVEGARTAIAFDAGALHLMGTT